MVLSERAKPFAHQWRSPLMQVPRTRMLWAAAIAAIAGLCIAWIVVGSFLLTSLLDRTPEHIKTWIRKPDWGTRIASGETYPVTIYEYRDADKHLITGRSVTYSFPPKYYVGWVAASHRASLNFSVEFDVPTGEAWRARSTRTGAGWRDDEAERKASASLSMIGPVHPQAKHLHEAKSRGVVKIEDISTVSKSCYGEYHWLGTAFCGYEMFEQCSRRNPMARAMQDYPFDVASIFAKPDGAGGYSHIVVCNQTSEAGWCRVLQPHPVAASYNIYFGGPQLCELDKTIDASNRLLEAHKLTETDRFDLGSKPLTRNSWFKRECNVEESRRPRWCAKHHLQGHRFTQ